MKKKVKILGLLLIWVLIMNCGPSKFQIHNEQAQNFLTRKDYAKAITASIHAMSLKTDNKESQEIFKTAVKEGIAYYTENISSAKKDPSECANVVDNYKKLIELVNIAKKHQNLLGFELKDYSQELKKSENLAGEYFYNEGIKLSEGKNSNFSEAVNNFLKSKNYGNKNKDLNEKIAYCYYNIGKIYFQKSDKDSKKQAAINFKQALDYYNGYKDAIKLYDKAKQAAIKIIAVFPFKDASGYDGGFGNIGSNVSNEIISSILTNEFLELISRDNIGTSFSNTRINVFENYIQVRNNDIEIAELGKKMNATEVIIGEITNVIYTPERISYQDYRETGKEQIGTEDVLIKGKMKKRAVYADAYARVRKYTKDSSCKILCSYKIIDVATGRIIKTETVEGNSSFKHEWGELIEGSADVVKTYRDLCRTPERHAPVATEMVFKAIKEVSKQISNSINEYFK